MPVQLLGIIIEVDVVEATRSVLQVIPTEVGNISALTSPPDEIRDTDTVTHDC